MEIFKQRTITKCSSDLGDVPCQVDMNDPIMIDN